MQREHDKEHFDSLASDFEKIKRKIIPGYCAIEKLVFSYLPFRLSQKIAVLELGTGPGTLALQLLKHFPRATYTGIDFSSKMLAVAAYHLKKCDHRVKLQTLDLNQSRPEGNYDVIVSLFTIHHVLNKKRLFKHLFSLLKPGGCLFYGDVAISKNKRLEKCFIENWKNFMTRSGLPKEKIRKVIADHRHYDQAESLEAQLYYLKAAGFTTYDIVWSCEKSAALFATK